MLKLLSSLSRRQRGYVFLAIDLLLGLAKMLARFALWLDPSAEDARRLLVETRETWET